ncbi:MAG: hypothetical protein NXI22_16940 [bacterium]|nr:hypothetical protein [bacterium]
MEERGGRSGHHKRYACKSSIDTRAMLVPLPTGIDRNKTVIASWWRRVAPSVWVGICTNALAFAAGAVFFTSAYGARFRGMEPEAMVFISLGLFAAASGLIVGIPVSIYDLIRKRWICAPIGFILAFTPFFVAIYVSELARITLKLTWD